MAMSSARWAERLTDKEDDEKEKRSGTYTPPLAPETRHAAFPRPRTRHPSLICRASIGDVGKMGWALQ